MTARRPSTLLVAALAVAAVGAGLALVRAPARGADAPPATPRSVEFMTRSMGTYARVVIVTADSTAAAPVARGAQAAFARVDSLMSNWTTTSEVARINRQPAGRATRVHPEVAIVLADALDIGRRTEGAFDITVEPLVRAWGFLGGTPHVPADSTVRVAFARVGMRHVRFEPKARRITFLKPGVRIDLGGIAKGYAVDVAADSLRAHGVRNALVDVSGNMFALGAPAGAAAWRIGVRDPHDRRRYFARLTLSGEAIATAASYEQFVAADGHRYGHIMDPRSGRPAEGLLAVTVIAPTALAADAWDTPLFVLGARKAMRVAAKRPDIAAILVVPGSAGVDTVFVEEILRHRFVLEPESAADFRVEYFE